MALKRSQLGEVSLFFFYRSHDVLAVLLFFLSLSLSHFVEQAKEEGMFSTHTSAF